MIAAADLSMAFMLPPEGAESFAERERTVVARMEALALELPAPRHPDDRPAVQPPEPPRDPRDVPSFHSRQRDPATADHLLDYAFASRGFRESIRGRVMNAVEERGSRDHCRILIDLD